ncbi:deoxycytidine triphosphate deaminase [Plesiocystis pacifica SIR-1]|uniref:Deoxycytidine triphosphate deaminase n=1 Tax=Plesiocystis pacifica SIR-1 TaxID=391625 RepID=A6G2I9_9BACT|nr:deoxycytidine triphosphate deaminase [Plesiocystis pacifica SIR-1]
MLYYGDIRGQLLPLEPE